MVTSTTEIKVDKIFIHHESIKIKYYDITSLSVINYIIVHSALSNLHTTV